MMGYEVYDKGQHASHRGEGKPMLRLTDKRIVFNRELTQILAERSIRHVHLLHDSETGKFAVRPCEAKDAYSYLLYANRAGNQAYVTVEAFLRRFGLQNRGVRAASWNADLGLVEF